MAASQSKKRLFEGQLASTVRGLDDDVDVEMHDADMRKAATTGADEKTPAASAIASAASVSEKNLRIINPDPSDLVVISPFLKWEKFPKKFESPSEPVAMEIDTDAKEKNKTTLSPDEIIDRQFKQLGTNRFLMEIEVSEYKFSDEKTGDLLAKCFDQHEVIRASFWRSNVFSKTNLNLSVVGAHQFLCTLSLPRCQLTPTQFVNLFAGLSQSHSILYLYLNATMVACSDNVDSSSVIFLALNQFLETTETLEVLQLTENHLTASQVKSFASGLSKSPLKQLWVGSNQMGTAGFCALLANFKGNFFEARNAMGEVETDDHSAAQQICETLATNPHFTSMELANVSHHWGVDAKIYEALKRSRNMTFFSMENSSRKADSTTDASINSLCSLVEARTSLEGLIIDRIYSKEHQQRVTTSILLNNRLTRFEIPDRSDWGILQNSAITARIKTNRIKAHIREYNWQCLAVLIAFVRANQSNPLVYSVFPFAKIIARLNFEENKLKKDMQSYQEIVAREQSNKPDVPTLRFPTLRSR